MDDTTKRFFNSIKISNCEQFDIKFLSGRKNSKNEWIFSFEKYSPWNFELLDFFLERVSNLPYSLSLEFKNKFDINNEIIYNLFVEYINVKANKDLANYVSYDEKCIYISEEKEADFKRIKTDFRSLLNLINYPDATISYSTNEFKKDEIKEIVQDEFIDENAENPADPEYFSDFSSNDDESVDADAEDFDEKMRQISEEKVREAEEFQRTQLEKLDKLFAGLQDPDSYDLCDLSEVTEERMRVLSSGKVFQVDDAKETNKGELRYRVGVHSGNASKWLRIITGKFIDKEFMKGIAKGTNITFTGVSRCDKFQNDEIVIDVNSLRIDPPTPLRDDLSEEKRVELHLHTNFSAMDGIASIESYCKLAKNMGMNALAVTDHGVVQAFPAAQRVAKKMGLKMIYGCELYVVDDYFDCVYNPTDEVINNSSFVVFDLETTGLSPVFDKIIEFGAVKVKDGFIVDSIDFLINPEEPLSAFTTKLTKITDDMLANAPKIEEVLPVILKFIGDSVLVSHNLKFDFNFLNETMKRLGYGELKSVGVDTLTLSQYFNPEERMHSLGALCRRNDVEYSKKDAHRADYDARVLGECFINMLLNDVSLNMSDDNADHSDKKPLGMYTYKDISRFKKGKKHIKHSFEEHVIVLCKNRNSLKSLYKLVSIAHTEYLGRFPSVPRSELEKYKDDFILGSACYNGRVFQAASSGTIEKLEDAIKFFDYIEIQPRANYSSLINSGSVKNYERLAEILNLIIEKSNKFNKPIVATGDVHYLNPDDKIFREIYINQPGIGKVSHPLKTARREEVNPYPSPDQYFRSTAEMLEEFKIYGEENAYNWVIKNSNLIADMCESYEPIDDNLYTPTIENCDKLLVDLCYSNAHKLYGDVLPEIVEERLKKELDGIVGNGYYVTYYIAHKIIKKAHEDGFIVGSRGSVGSSFAATMADITEVNPLPPHYRCPKCKHFELYGGKDIFSGYDLPPKKCPDCGEEMIGDGQNIPFETFLGFHAEKVPDIDLNFPPDYQAKAHDYTKVLLGEENVFRAGTIGTASNKTAFGYAKGYLERSKKLTSSTSNAEISYLASGCIDVKRTTGQHPGGIVVVPKGYEIYDFSAVQYPADDLNASWKTTHFEFESIHDTLLKLDLLGHVDPQALKMLLDLTGVNEKDIPFNDPKVLSLFASPNALKLKHNYLKAINGVLAIPEFGTEFVTALVANTVPTTFSELLIISGLSHGTGVWRNNAENIIKNKEGTLRDVIGCRDDIMTYLISKGIDSSIAFDTMEKVRKGKGLPAESEKVMREHNVPEYYINSCKKIEYLFPKAHATAYVSNGIRVAWFKIYKPLEFYATFFSVRVDKYDWESMRKGPQAIMDKIKEMDERKKNDPRNFTKTDEEVVKTLKVSLEMYDRGITFEEVNIKESDSKLFKVNKEKNSLIPPFFVIDGLGLSASEILVNCRNEKEFVSVEDVVARAKINNTILDIFRRLGVFGDLPEKENAVTQLSLFDF